MYLCSSQELSDPCGENFLCRDIQLASQGLHIRNSVERIHFQEDYMDQMAFKPRLFSKYKILHG